MMRGVGLSGSVGILYVDNSLESRQAEEVLRNASFVFEATHESPGGGRRKPVLRYSSGGSYEGVNAIRAFIRNLQLEPSMVQDVNARELGEQCARAAPGTSIVAWPQMLAAVRDNPTIRSIMREWMRRLKDVPPI